MTKKRGNIVTKQKVNKEREDKMLSKLLQALRNDGKLRDSIRAVFDELPPWTSFADVTYLIANRTVNLSGIKDPLLTRDLLSFLNEEGKTQIFLNSRYIVHRTELANGGYTLSIRTIQNDARHDWREFQRIKNELCGPNREAVELYPSEERLVDTANQFYLHVLPEGQYVACGFNERVVLKPSNCNSDDNQRPWEPGMEPPDAKERTEANIRDLLQTEEKKRNERQTKNTES